MAATRTSRRSTRQAARPSTRRTARARKATPRRVVKRATKPAVKPVVKVSKLTPAPRVQYRLCRAGWAVIVETIQNAQGTRFVCPFCTVSHRVSGPVRGFKRVRRAQWIKMRRVEG
jgi:hypothetical protein